MVRTAKQTDRLNALESRCGDASGRLASVTALGHSSYLREVIHAISGRIHSRGWFGGTGNGLFPIQKAKAMKGDCNVHGAKHRAIMPYYRLYRSYLGKTVCRAVVFASVLILIT